MHLLIFYNIVTKYAKTSGNTTNYIDIYIYLYFMYYYFYYIINII